MDFSAYKAFLFDVDKTLSNSQREITETTQQALTALADKKIQLGVATGRSFPSLSHVLSYFPSDALHVVNGGGEIITAQGDTSWASFIPSASAKEIMALATAQNCRALCTSAKVLYGNEKAIAQAQAYFLHDQTFRTPTQIEEIENWDTIALITVSDVNDAFVQSMSGMPIIIKHMIGYRGNRYTDITAQGVTKAEGVRQWCAMRGIKPEEVIGFGDGENDLEFLQTVGYAVAMGNASDELKAIADEVTDDCDHDGVATWIEKNV